MWDKLYKNIFRKILFNIEPESAHKLSSFMITQSSLALRALEFYLSHRSFRLQQSIAGINFEGPVGMAAGFDKTGELYPYFRALGFHFAECGSFTARPQFGNPKPRLFRLTEERALINRLGFNNPGASAAAQNFSKQRHLLPRGVNIGKTRQTPLEAEAVIADYCVSLRQLAAYADYICVNVSSPNTPGLRQLQKGSYLSKLILALKKELRTLQAADTVSLAPRKVPLFVKLSPDLSVAELAESLDVLLDAQVDAVVVSNTSTDQSQLPLRKRRAGGLSGRPLRAKSTALIDSVYKRLRSKIPIIGVGGIEDGPSALEKILAGASLIQIYTGYIYQGPLLPKQIALYLDRFLEKENCTLASIVGRGS